MADYDGGRVFLQVVPSFTGVQAAIAARAAKWGEASGKAYKDAFDREARKISGGGGPGGGPGPGAASGAKQGEQYGGAYASAFRRKLEAASRTLPPARITGDFSALDRKLALLRNQIQSLSGKTIGIDISADDAIAEARRIEHEIQAALRDQTLTIEARSDLTATLAQIKAVREEAERPAHMRIDMDLDQGAFAQRARAAIEKAQASLPKIEIDADSTPAQVEVQRIRSSLTTLRDKRIGIDMTAEQFNAETTKLQERLAVVTRTRTVDIRTRTDAAATLAALEALDKETGRLNGRRIRLDLDSGGIDQFSGRLVVLGTAIGALAPALVPIGGAAIVALGGLGAAAGAVLPTLGALILGLKGVGTAVGAMADAQRDAAADGEKAATQARTQAAARASAARSVEGAEASLANAVEAARTAEVRSARQVTDAAKAVQKAREDAAKAGEDAAQRIADANESLVKAQDAQQRQEMEGARKVADARAALADAEEAQARDAIRISRDVADAAQRVTDVQEEAARDGEAASRRVADARQREADVSKDAARSIQDALQKVSDAETDLASAQADELAVQQDLTAARKAAAQQLEDLANSVAGGALDQRDAILDVADAQDALNKVLNDPTSGDRTRARAQLAYEQSVQRLKELELRNQRLGEEQAAAAAAGVDGSEQVTQAQQRIADALERRQAAEKALAEAGAGVDEARATAARNLADAQQAVADALAAQALQQQQSDRAIADAQQASTDAVENAAQRQKDALDRITGARRDLADAQDAQTRADQDAADAVAEASQKVTDAVAAQTEARLAGLQSIADAEQAQADAVTARADQQRSAAQSIENAERSLEGAREAAATAAQNNADAVSSSQKKLQESMDDLGPAGQRFATFLFGLRGDVSKLQEAAAGGMLPGFETAIRAILPLMPTFEKLLSTFGTALGNLAISAANALNSEEWGRFFDFLNTNGGAIVQTFSDLAGNVLGLFPALATAFGPIGQEVGDVLVNLTGSFKDFLQGAGGSTAFQDFLNYVRDTAPQVGEFIGQLADAFVQIIRSMAPMGPVVLAIVGGFAQLIASIPPGVLEAVALAVLGIVIGFGYLLPVVQAVIGFVSGLMAAIGTEGLVAALAGLLPGVGWVIAAVVLLGAAFIAAWQHSETFRDVVKGALGAVKDFVVGVVWERGLKPALQALADFFTDVVAPAAVWLWHNVFEPAFGAIGKIVQIAWAVIKLALDALVWYWQNILQPALGFLWHNVFEPAFGAISKVVEIAWAVIKLALDALIWYWNNVLGPAVAFWWHNVFEPAFKGIGDIVVYAWEHFIQPALEALRSFFVDTLGPAVEKGVSAFTAGWDKIKAAAAVPINFVIREIYGGTDENKGIRGLFTKVAKAVDSDARLPAIDEIGYSGGGWTGPGAKFEEAGVVHRDEFVIQKESRARFERDNPGALDYLNRTGRLPIMGGYAKGGIVDLGHWFQGKGARVAEHPAFGGVSNVHKGRGHYEGRAIDVNKNDPKTGASESAYEKAFFDQFAVKLRDAGWTVFWRDNRPQDHSNHLHAEAPTKTFAGDFPGGGFVSAIGDAISGAIGSVADFLNPFDDILSRMGGEDVLQSPFAQLGKGAVGKGIGLVKDWASSKLSAITDKLGFGTEDDSANGNYRGGGVEKWRGTALQALSMTGFPASMVGSLLRRMDQESGGDPRAINNWDSNAKKGDPSRGLMQTIMGTFKQYALPGYNQDIYDPLSNILASIRYAAKFDGNPTHRWDRKGGYAHGGRVGDPSGILGMSKNIGPAALAAIQAGPKLYDEGGMLPPGYTLVNNATGKPEPVLTHGELDRLAGPANGRDRLEPILRRIAELAEQGNGITAEGLQSLGTAVRDQPRTARQLQRQGA